MDILSSGPWQEKVGFLRWKKDKPSDEVSEEPERLSNVWKQLMDLFDEDVYRGDASLQFRVLVTMIRFGTMFIVIPLWFLLGFVTAGLLWPSQLRKKILQQRITN